LNEESRSQNAEVEREGRWLRFSIGNRKSEINNQSAFLHSSF